MAQEIILSDGTHKKTITQKAASAILAAVMLCNANIVTVAALITFGPLWVESAFAQEEDDELLKELRNKHNLNNPYRQFQNVDVEEGMYGEPVNKDITDKLENMLNNRSDKQLDLSKYIKEEGVAEEQVAGYKSEALRIGFKQQLPTSNESGNQYNVRYNKESKLEVFRDPETGKLEVRTKENADEIKTVEAGIADDEIFSAQTNHHQTSFEGKDTYGDEDALFQVGRDTHTKLKADSTNTGESISYKTVTGFARKAINTEVPEQILQAGYSAVEHASSEESDFFSSCSTTTNVEQGSLYRPEETVETCSQPNADNLFYCELEREFRVPVVIEAEGVKSCGPGCYAVMLGENTPDSLKASSDCSLFEASQSFLLNLAPGMSLSSVKLQGAADDHTKITINGVPVYSLVWEQEGVDLELPPTGPGAAMCEVSAWQEYNRDITATFNNLFESQKSVVGDNEQLFVEIEMDTAIRHYGGHYLEVQFQFDDLSGLGFGDVIHQTPAGCFDRVAPQIKDNGGIDGLRSMGFDESNFPASQCRFDSYEMLEEGSRNFPDEFLEVMGPLHPGDEGWVNWHTNLKGYTCDPFQGGEFCVGTGPDGEETCYYWDDIRNQENQCQAYEEDDRCSETSRECVEGWEDEETGICYLEEVDFTCDYGNNVTYEYTTTSSSCDGMIPCAGGDCDFGAEERNDRFNEALVMSNVMEHMQSDSSCEDPSDPSTCRIFEGEYEYCSWESSGLGSDCCEKPSGVEFLTYLKLSMATMDLQARIANGAFGETAANAVNGAWDTLSQPIIDAGSYVWGELYKPFTSAVESAVGNVVGEITTETGTALAENFGGGILGALKQQIAQFVYDLLPEGLGKAIFAVSGSGANATVTGFSAPVQSALNFLGTVMAIYAAYQILKLALMLVSACDENEQDVGLKLEMRQCFQTRDKYCHKKWPWGGCMIKRKDHCCYSSMLSRIIMEQAGPLLNKDMSQCEGLTMDEIGRLDFSQIDLSEWVGTLYEADMIPEASEDGLTGSGRTDNKYSRQTASERTKERTKDIDKNIEATKDHLKKPNVDCSIYPRPPVCDYQFNPEDDGS